MKSIFCLIVHLILMQGLALKAFDLYSWGYNGVGQVGDGTVITRTSPVNISSNSDWLIFKCGVVHTAAIKTDGTLWAWGFNSVGQLGDGSTTDKHEPVQAGTDTDWAHVSCGWLHTVAIKKNGTLWAWGNNGRGQLGDSTNFARNNPIQIGTDTNWVHVACGLNHNLAIKSDGTLWAWGDNEYGQLGDETTINRTYPIQIGNDNDWKQIACSGFHTMAIKNDGSLWGWGDNSWGQFPDDRVIVNNPIQIGSDYDWKSVACGFIHTLGIRTDGTLWGFGRNYFGEVGDGTNSSKKRPVLIGSDTDWVYISCGGYHSKGIKSDGTLWTWGQNSLGQLGDGTNTNRFNPVKIVSDVRWKTVKCGFDHSLALFDIVPILISPTNKEFDLETNLTFKWKNFATGAIYNFQLSTDKDFSNIIIQDSEISATEYLVAGLARNTIYYWRVKAIELGGESDWSDVWQFTTEKHKHPLPLATGWNMISTYVEPENTALESIFADIVESTIIVKNNIGQIYYPEFEINDIGNWDMKQAYQVYMSKAETLTISGMKIIPETTEIALATGWNMLAYLRDNPMDIEIALAPLVANENLIIAKDNMGKVFYPAFEINMIGDMLPGQGYQIYLLSNDTLVYPEN